METSTILTYVGILVGLIIIILLVKGWIKIYNKFQYWWNRVNRKFADIDIIMQERVDKILALAQVIKKYDIHEYKTLKDVTETRSRWTKDTSINKKVETINEMENNYIKIQAIFEKYPQLKAEGLHNKIMGRSNISSTEGRLREARLSYNRVAQNYNERVSMFPRNIVARVHGFKTIEYLSFDGQAAYNPKKLFED
jgi:LemA protein